MSCHDMMLARKKRNAAKKAKAMAAAAAASALNGVNGASAHVNGIGAHLNGTALNGTALNGSALNGAHLSTGPTSTLTHSTSSNSIHHRPEHARRHSNRLSYGSYNKDKSLPSIPAEFANTNDNPKPISASPTTVHPPPPPPPPFYQTHNKRQSGDHLSSSSSIGSLTEAINIQKNGHVLHSGLGHAHVHSGHTLQASPRSLAPESTNVQQLGIPSNNSGPDLEDYFSQTDSGFVPIKLDMSSIPLNASDIHDIIDNAHYNHNRRSSIDALKKTPVVTVPNRRSILPTKSSSSTSSNDTTMLSVDEQTHPRKSVEGYHEPPNGSHSTRNAIYLSDSNLPSSWSLGDFTDDTEKTETTENTENSGNTSPELVSPPTITNDYRKSRSLKPDTLIPDRSMLRSVSPRPVAKETATLSPSPSLPAFAPNRSISPITVKTTTPITPKSVDITVEDMTPKHSSHSSHLRLSPLLPNEGFYPAIETIVSSSPSSLPSHRRSVSDTRHINRLQSAITLEAAADITSNSSSSPSQNTTEEVASVLSANLTRELIEANKRIVQLERLLKEKDDTPNLKTLESDIQEKRKTIADLEAHGVVVRKEIQLLETVKDGGESTSQLLDEFSNELATVKSSLMKEITELVIQRDNLKAENEKLIKLRDKAVEESSILNIKNSQLADMNNELSKQMYDKFGKTMSGSASSNSLSVRRKEVLGAHSPSRSKDNIQSNYDEPLVTILDAGHVIDTRKDRQHARKFWKRPGAVVAKGLTKVFATDFEAGPEFYDDNMNTHNINNISNTNGSTTTTTTTNNKNSRNGWFKTSDTTSNGSAIAAAALAATVTLGQPNSNSNSNSNNNSNNSQVVRGSLPSSASSSSTVVANAASNTTSKKDTTSLMGASIEWRVSHEGNRIPIIVTRCIEEVEKRGMSFEGIYRKSGGKSQVTAIEEAFAKTWEGNFDDVLSGDISGVTSALKQYLRYLPIPLITFDTYQDFIETSSITTTSEEDKINKLRSVINSLPPSHHDCLEHVVRHLAKVTKFSSQNLMTARNIAVVFAPTLARDKTGEREMTDMQARNDSTQLLIDKYDSIFTGF